MIVDDRCAAGGEEGQRGSVISALSKGVRFSSHEAEACHIDTVLKLEGPLGTGGGDRESLVLTARLRNLKSLRCS